jgi:hypothetical protein
MACAAWSTRPVGVERIIYLCDARALRTCTVHDIFMGRLSREHARPDRRSPARKYYCWSVASHQRCSAHLLNLSQVRAFRGGYSAVGSSAHTIRTLRPSPVGLPGVHTAHQAAEEPAQRTVHRSSPILLHIIHTAQHPSDKTV